MNYTNEETGSTNVESKALKLMNDIVSTWSS